MNPLLILTWVFVGWIGCSTLGLAVLFAIDTIDTRRQRRDGRQLP